jgi:transcriptional regulator with XRE-family HTH domain
MKNMTKDEIRENIRKNLIDLRKKKGMTQAQLASIFEKTDNAVASWEQGLSLPDIPTLYKLSLVYEVPMEYFVVEHSRKDDEQ